MTKGRLEAFSDGVFAVAITLLILDVHPEGGLSGWEMLSHDWHKILVYVLSFVIVGVYWVMHNRIMSFITAVNTTFLWINLFLLMIIVFIPYVAALLSASRADPGAIRIYGTTLIFANLGNMALFHYATRNRRLVSPSLPSGFSRFALLLGALPILIYGLAVALASWCPIISLIMFASVPVSYILSSPFREKRSRQVYETMRLQETHNDE